MGDQKEGLIANTSLSRNMAEPLKPSKPSKESKGSAPKIKNTQKTKASPSTKASVQRESGIPKPVANRMARRITILTGIPTVAGMGVFIASYLVVSKGIADIPPVLTLVTSATCFLIGLLGLSFGMLSASWEESPGSLLGLENIQPNIGRMRSAFKLDQPNKT